MSVDHECTDYATECIRLAGLTDDLEVRDQLVEPADTWRMREASATNRTTSFPCGHTVITRLTINLICVSKDMVPCFTIWEHAQEGAFHEKEKAPEGRNHNQACAS